MRCKKHPADLSSGVGICASCLRERLFAVMAAQAQKQALLHHPQHNFRKSETLQPTPLSFPRSVSPYISRRNTDTSRAAAWNLYRTPQVGPTGSLAVEFQENGRKKRSGGGRFSSLFFGLFRSKSEKLGSDSVPKSDPGVSVGSCSASPSWFTSVVIGRRKKQIRTFSLDETGIRAQRRNRDRGMSPAIYSDNEDDGHCHGGSSGYSSESSKQTPRRTPAATQGRGTGHVRNVSGLTFCLSPLVRASPNRHWNQPDSVASGGESRGPQKSRQRTATAFCKNRSRKLADFGRYSYKH